MQQQRRDDEKLSVQEVRTLNLIRKGTDKKAMDIGILKKLEKEGLIERVGKTSAQQFILSKAYFIFTNRRGDYAAGKPLHDYQVGILIGQYFSEFDTATMSDFTRLLDHHLTRNQVRYKIEQLVQTNLLQREGKGSGTIYRFSDAANTDTTFLNKALGISTEEQKTDELNKEP